MKKLSKEDIIKLGGSFKARILKDDEKTRQMIVDVKKQQEEIMRMAKIDWNDPNLRKPMDI